MAIKKKIDQGTKFSSQILMEWHCPCSNKSSRLQNINKGELLLFNNKYTSLRICCHSMWKAQDCASCPPHVGTSGQSSLSFDLFNTEKKRVKGRKVNQSIHPSNRVTWSALFIYHQTNLLGSTPFSCQSFINKLALRLIIFSKRKLSLHCRKGQISCVRGTILTVFQQPCWLSTRCSVETNHRSFWLFHLTIFRSASLLFGHHDGRTNVFVSLYHFIDRNLSG